MIAKVNAFLSLTRAGLLAMVVLATFWAAPAMARNVALVIGNSNYAMVPALPNPINDARAMADMLRSLGFDVISGLDLDTNGTREAVARFAAALEGADTGLLFYAGHGIQVADKNYIVPVNASLSSEADVYLSLVPFDEIQRVMESVVPTRLLFIDACRDNPMARSLSRSLGTTRSAMVGRGLASMRASVGTLIGYATAPGEVAWDGTGQHSPFTQAMLDHIETRGLEVTGLLRRVRQQVIEDTDGRQVPWDTSSLVRAIYLAGEQAPAPAPAATAAPAEPDPALAREQALWAAIGNSDRAEDYQSYLDQYPQGIYAGLAASRRDALSRETFETAAVSRSEPAAAAPAAPASSPPLRGRFNDGCRGCPEMVAVEGGSFLMGSPAGEEGRDGDEGPQRTVLVAPFAMSRSEVTFAEWDACVAAGGCNRFSPDDAGWGRGRQPVINISFEDAMSFVEWLSRTTGERYRLPSEAEWEYAARAGTETAYALGRSIAATDANFDSRHGQVMPVATYQPNVMGFHDMHGNAAEWVADCWHPDYRGAPPHSRARTDGACDARTLRGGSGLHDAANVRSAARFKANPQARSAYVGFRVARDLDR